MEITFSDGSTLILREIWVKSILLEYGDSLESFLNEIKEEAETLFKQRKTLTKFGVCSWGQYPAKDKYETIAEVAEDVVYYYIRPALMSLALLELTKQQGKTAPGIVTITPNGFYVYKDGQKKYYQNLKDAIEHSKPSPSHNF